MRHRRNEEQDGFFCRFTFGQFFALLVLEVFTLFFVFYLGARYGREFLGMEKGPDVAFEAQYDSEGQRVATTSDPEVARMADELVAKAKTPALKEQIREMISQAQGGRREQLPQVEKRRRVEEEPKPLPEKELSGGGDFESREYQIVKEAGSEKTSATTNAATDSSVIRVKSGESGRYSVQVGSYPQMSEATRIVERWKKKGYPAYMMIADIPDRGRWYRVRIGGFENRKDAKRYQSELQSREGVEALVVLNEQ